MYNRPVNINYSAMRGDGSGGDRRISPISMKNPTPDFAQMLEQEMQK